MKPFCKSSRVALVSLIVCCFLEINSVKGTGLQTDPAKPRILITSGVRARTDPAVTAAEVAKLQLGSIVNELQPSPNKDKIGGVEDYWYRVAFPDGKEGWVFGGFTLLFDTNKREEIYRRIAADRLKIKTASF